MQQGGPLSPLLFVIVMDVLEAMFLASEHNNILVDLQPMGLKHQVSLYTDDVVVFARSDRDELLAVKAIQGCFGSVSGLVVNYSKSSAAAIHYSKEVVNDLTLSQPCPIIALPCKYLGLPLTVKKLSKTNLRSFIDKLGQQIGLL
jgi:hypothetical protein